jgi:hypothetical protein
MCGRERKSVNLIRFRVTTFVYNAAAGPWVFGGTRKRIRLLYVSKAKPAEAARKVQDNSNMH